VSFDPDALAVRACRFERCLERVRARLRPDDRDLRGRVRLEDFGEVLDLVLRDFVVELDGLHAIHLGDIGHLLSEEKLGDIGSVDIACVPVGGALSATKAAALVAQLDPKMVVAMPVCERDTDCTEAIGKFFHEMGGEPTPQPKLSVTISTLPDEVTAVVLESRSKT